MTDEYIAELLEKLNRGGSSEIIIGKIGERVWWGFVYAPMPEETEHFDRIGTKGEQCFFVQNAEGEFVGAVHWFGAEEMHWFVSENHRQKSVLVEPLRSVILPFIFARYDQDSQQGSIELGRKWANYSLRLAEKVGFRKISESSTRALLEASRKDFPDYGPIRPLPLNASDYNLLQREIRVHIRALQMVLDVVRTKHLRTDMEISLVEESCTNLLCARISLADTLKYGISS